jgi:hypothetical protein
MTQVETNAAKAQIVALRQVGPSCGIQKSSPTSQSPAAAPMTIDPA